MSRSSARLNIPAVAGTSTVPAPSLTVRRPCGLRLAWIRTYWTSTAARSSLVEASRCVPNPSVRRIAGNYGMPYYLQYGGVPCRGGDDQVVTYLIWNPTVSEPRLTFFLQRDLNAALLIARADDRVPAAERIRAALDLWAEDPAVRQQIDDRSRELTRAEGPRVKLTVSVSPERQHQLTLGRASDGVSATARIRAALNLWHSDAPLRARIDALAAERRRQRMANRPRSGAVAHP